jgi:hypothetical protein
MVDYNKIFDRNTHTTDVGELLMVLFDRNNTLADKRKVWRKWRDEYFSNDALIEFFSDSLFADDKSNYLDAILKCEYKNFYELACTLDLAGIDPKAYYVYWILCYGHKYETSHLKEALEYDPDTIKGMFPDIEQVIMNEEV